MKDLNTKISVAAAISMAVAIVLGAFGAHGLEKLVDTDSLNTFEVGVRYHIYHSLAMLVVGLSQRVRYRLKKRTFILWFTGLILFSGSLYLLAIDEALGADLGFLGPVTPIGGTILILGWIFLAIGLWKNK